MTVRNRDVCIRLEEGRELRCLSAKEKDILEVEAVAGNPVRGVNKLSQALWSLHGKPQDFVCEVIGADAKGIHASHGGSSNKRSRRKPAKGDSHLFASFRRSEE